MAMSASPSAGPPVSVSFRAAVRLVGELTFAALALLTALMVARDLGPAGKGIVSTLSYLIALVAPACVLGLAEVGVTMTKRREVSDAHALGALLGTVALTSVMGAALVVLMVIGEYRAYLGILEGATLAAVVSVPCMALFTGLSLLADGRGAVYVSTAAKVVSALVTALATFVLVWWLELAIAGAITAIGLGFGSGAALAGWWLWRHGGRQRPRWSASYVRRAVRLGLPVQGSILLFTLASRADLLVVQIISGPAEAGLYSVSLTMGQLASYAPIAVAVAAFPVAAGLDRAEAAHFVERIVRAGTAGALVAAVALGALLPVLIPALFGASFRDAVVPALILLPAGVMWGMQLMVCRLWAAQGEGGLLLRSSSALLATLLLGDFALVPSMGGTGASIAAVAASLVAVVVAVRGHLALAGEHGSATRLFPRVGDLVAALRSAAAMAPRRRG